MPSIFPRSQACPSQYAKYLTTSLHRYQAGKGMEQWEWYQPSERCQEDQWDSLSSLFLTSVEVPSHESKERASYSYPFTNWHRKRLIQQAMPSVVWDHEFRKYLERYMEIRTRQMRRATAFILSLQKQGIGHRFHAWQRLRGRQDSEEFSSRKPDWGVTWLELEATQWLLS